MDGWHQMVSRFGVATPIKYLADLANGYAFKSEDWAADGTPIIRIENLNGSENFNRIGVAVEDRYRVRAGDLLFSWSGNRGTSFGPHVWEQPGDWYLNQHIFKVSERGVDRRWLFWALKAATEYIEQQTSGIIGMVHVTKFELGSIPLPVPTLAEQREIADFLDAETARIDTLIAKKQQLIDRIEERRSRLTLAGVVGELTHGGEVRQSDLEWADTVPAHWDVALLRLVARQGTGHTPSRSRPEWWIAEECVVPWVTTGEVQQVRSDRARVITETREKVSPAGLANSSAEIHPRGTVLLCRTASAGYSGIMGADMATSQDFATWTCGESLDPEYLLLCLRAMRPDLLGRLATGSTHKTIYMPDIQALKIPVPPIGEQREIAALLKCEIDSSFNADDALTSQISLLAERRQALITAAVTGGVAC
jgi:type I restriction enzyme, S subunit